MVHRPQGRQAYDVPQKLMDARLGANKKPDVITAQRDPTVGAAGQSPLNLLDHRGRDRARPETVGAAERRGVELTARATAEMHAEPDCRRDPMQNKAPQDFLFRVAPVQGPHPLEDATDEENVNGIKATEYLQSLPTQLSESRSGITEKV